MRRLIPVVLSLAFLLCSCSKPGSVVMTEPPEDDVFVSYLRLSDGVLHFKTQDELIRELTAKDFTDNAPKPEDYHVGQLPQDGRELDGVRKTDAEELKCLMCLNPSAWTIDEALREKEEEHFYYPQFYRLDDGSLAYVETSKLFCFSFADGNPDYTQRRELLVYVDPAPRRWTLGSSADEPFADLTPLAVDYGKEDSRVGKQTLSIVVRSEWFSAFFTRGNAAWEVRGRNVSQREFAGLLLSLTQAEAGTQDVIAWLLSD